MLIGSEAPRPQSLLALAQSPGWAPQHSDPGVSKAQRLRLDKSLLQISPREGGRAEVPEIVGREPPEEEARAEPESCIHKHTPTRLAGSRSGGRETNGKFWNVIHVMVALLPCGVQFAEATFQPRLFITP